MKINDQFCHQFQTGNGKRENCSFKHVMMTEQEKKDSNYDPEKLLKKNTKPKGKSRNNEKNKLRKVKSRPHGFDQKVCFANEVIKANLPDF